MSKDKTPIILGAKDNIVEVSPRKSGRAKSIIIKFSQKKGFELIVPNRVSMKSAINFLYKRENWILKKNQELKQRNNIIFESGAKVPILGDSYIVKHTGLLRGITRIEGKHLLVSGLEGHIQRKAKQFLIKSAKEQITLEAMSYAKNLKVKFKKITVRDTITRWGSCSRSGNLSFSWRLIMAPRAVMEYVVVHELAHLHEMNHSKKFWDIVARAFPAYKQARSWLRTHGDDLHSYIK